MINTPTPPAHRVRPHTFSGDQTYELGTDALHVRHRGIAKDIPYADIASVRVIDYANMGEVHGQCTVKTRGHGKLNIRSHHYRSLGAFEDRSETYAPFVRELCRRLQTVNPAPRFLKGSGWIQMLWLVVLIFTGFGWVMWFATVMDGGQDIETGAGFFIGLLVTTAASWHWLTHSKPETFDPLDPPVA